ncbi:MAG: HAD hydrolase family protein [Thomasclavelia ramosa]
MAEKIRELAQTTKHYQINLGEVMAFCDGNNDIDMLKHVGVGVAMGNATDFVTRHD